MKNKVTKKQVEDYIKFLEKALASKNFKNNEPEKYEKYKQKLDKERLKVLKELNWVVIDPGKNTLLTMMSKNTINKTVKKNKKIKKSWG